MKLRGYKTQARDNREPTKIVFPERKKYFFGCIHETMKIFSITENPRRKSYWKLKA